MVRSRWMIPALALVALLAASCSDDGGDDTSTAESTTTTSAVDGAAPTTDEEPSPTDGGGGAGAVGSVTVDGEERPLDRITGVLSCQLDGSGDLSVAAESDTATEDGGTYLRLDVYADDPGGNEFSVAAGTTEYVSAAPDAIDYELDGEVVTGTVAVEPLFEEGTAQEVTFEVDCGAA